MSKNVQFADCGSGNVGKGGRRNRSKPFLLRKASVIGFEERGDIVVYKIQVRTTGGYHYCYKTFEDIQNFHEKVQTIFPELRWVIKFPSKEWFWQSRTKGMLAERAEKFKIFVEKVTSTSKYSSNSAVRFFLDQDLKELKNAVHFYRKECYVLRTRKNRKESQREELQKMLANLKEVNQMYLIARVDYQSRERRNSKKVKKLWMHLERNKSSSSSDESESDYYEEEKERRRKRSRRKQREREKRAKKEEERKEKDELEKKKESEEII